LLKTGIIGAGKMARHHAKALGVCGAQNELVGVVEPDSDARVAFATAFPGCEPFEHLQELIEARHPDVLHICTPGSTHVELGRAAIEAGCHVYIEKPFALRSSQARELFRLADERAVRLCAGHQLLYERPTLQATRLLQSIGRIVHVESMFSFRMVRRGTLTDDEQILDILPHPTYLLLHFLRAAHGAGPFDPRLVAVRVDREGTIHALATAGGPSGSLVVTLDGRPVESFVRVVGTNGTVHADYVRGTVQHLIGPGVSGIDKLLNPYRHSRQLIGQTTSSLIRRLRRRGAGYPGLAETIHAFYTSLVTDQEAVSRENILGTTEVLERVAMEIAALESATDDEAHATRPVVAVTGGTGWLGSALVGALSERGHPVRVLARRRPAPWSARPGVDYRRCDLGLDLAPDTLQGVSVVVHTAAETVGGWEEHERNSVRATENLLRAARRASVRQVVYVSSVAVLEAQTRSGAIDEHSPYVAGPRAAGPYVWGKLEAETTALSLGEELGLDIRVVRPGALIDREDFDPPGRLGKRLGNLFVAVGNPGETLGVVDLGFAAAALCWLIEHPEDAPPLINLLSPELPTKRELVSVLRERNPALRVMWVPRFAVRPLAFGLRLLQRALRPRRAPIDIAKVFDHRSYETVTIARLAPAIVESVPMPKRVGGAEGRVGSGKRNLRARDTHSSDGTSLIESGSQ
jgi:predicted dehydrogenase/nucleoside-diphosphate-sugar epimerase